MEENIIDVEAIEVVVHEHPEGKHYIWSYELAEVFGKRHADVLNTIDRHRSELTEDEFEPFFRERRKTVSLGPAYPGGLNRTREDRYYAMTKGGFDLVAFGFTGRKALRYKIAYIKRFAFLDGQYQLRLREDAARAAAMAAADDGVLRLVPFTSHQKQLQCSKLVASHYMQGTRDANPAMDHFRRTFKAVTGKTPTNYVHQKAKEGHRVLSQSGRGALRKLEPEKACVIAMMDDQVMQHGLSVDQQVEAGLPEALAPAFAALLKLGYGLPQLEIPTKSSAARALNA